MTRPATTTTLTCVDGANFDLIDPQPEDVSFLVICEHLAKANRYGGATPGLVYSVAQHSVLCAQAALDATGDREIAAYLLCHDMHEAYLGDDTTPKKRALTSIMMSFGAASSLITSSFAALTDRIDLAIHSRAGLAWPPTPEIAAAVHKWDRILLATEWRDLMQFDPPYDFGHAPLPARVIPRERWSAAAADMLSLCQSLLPNKVR